MSVIVVTIDHDGAHKGEDANGVQEDGLNLEQPSYNITALRRNRFKSLLDLDDARRQQS